MVYANVNPINERMSVGQRVELHRRRRRLSRRLVAGLVGRSEEWLRLIEKGKLKLDNVHTILRLAEVLGIKDFRELIELPSGSPAPITQPAQELVELLRLAIYGYPGIDAYVETGRTEFCRDHLAREVARCTAIWGNSRDRYTLLAQRLPRLLATCRAMSWAAQDCSTRTELVRASFLCREVLTKLNAHHLAALVADRALMLASHEDGRQLLAASSWHWADALFHLGERRQCLTFAVAAAKAASLDIGDSHDAVLFGALHLVAAKGAATAAPAEVNQLIATAYQLAQEARSVEQVHGISFGNTEISLVRMEIALSQGDFEAAMEFAADIEGVENQSTAQRSRYYITLAGAYAGRGEIVAAAFALTQAAEACPDDLRYDLRAHSVLQRIIQSDNRLLTTQIAQLSRLAGIA
ncbi:helix-turn-helix domain-containing protein [Mycobacterium syngnathidarum]